MALDSLNLLLSDLSILHCKDSSIKVTPSTSFLFSLIVSEDLLSGPNNPLSNVAWNSIISAPSATEAERDKLYLNDLTDQLAHYTYLLIH